MIAQKARAGDHAMRLICPSCGAQYEIDDDLIPPGGRDVQCSDCSHIWFESPTADIAGGDPSGDDDAPDAGPGPTPAPDPVPPHDPAPAPEETAEPDSRTAKDPTPRRDGSVDPEVARILREEAEAERSLRAQTRERLETQPDLGLHSAPPAEPHGNRRDQLPDIDTINSSFRDETETPAAPQRDGFWPGFWVVVMLAALAGAAYVFADAIGARVPSLAPTLEDYVAWVDGVRLWLNYQVTRLQG